jgi:multicomponent Na+:H+ antiporter subunit D
VIENDLRRVLAYSLINQVGFMVCGIGLGTAMAINGAIAHAFNDVVFKGLLFMSMGAVLFRTGKINGSQLGGLYKSMPWTTGFCIVGAASISAFPLFSGFVSKSMVMVAALEDNHTVVWLALLFASAGVFHHAGIKIPYFAFYAHDSGIRCREAPANMLIAMALAAAICIFNGAYPWVLYDMLPFPVDYEPYTAAHILTQCQLLFFSALAFVWLNLKGLYPPELRSTNIDVEWTYRRLLPAAAIAVRNLAGRGWDRLAGAGRHAAGSAVAGTESLLIQYGMLGRTWAIRTTALWILVLLTGYVFVQYL